MGRKGGRERQWAGEMAASWRGRNIHRACRGSEAGCGDERASGRLEMRMRERRAVADKDKLVEMFLSLCRSVRTRTGVHCISLPLKI